jgi:nicotinate-nucleotide adenylyltransferase
MSAIWMSSTVPAKPSEPPVGILGGTFDPIHNAHLRLAQEAERRFGLETVLFIPAGRPWHRASPLASAEHRLAMVHLAVAGHPRFSVDDTEVRTEAPGYTVDTLERLRREFGPTRPLVLLLGADAFLGLPGWHRWQAVLELAHVGVATRPGNDLVAAAMPALLAQEYQRRLSEPERLAQRPAGAIAPFILSAGTVSSTAVRAQRGAGADIRDLLPDRVVDYIDLHHLYLGD